jgi:hypothetical protein
MSRARRVRGRTVQYESPEWQPLLEFAPAHVDDFMWMHEVELHRNHRVHAFKHIWTRRYIHLDHEGRAFAYCGDDLYQEVDPVALLDQVLWKDKEGPPPYDIVRQNLWTGSIELIWTRSATKHRISRKRSAYVIENCNLFFEEYEQEGTGPLSEDPRLLFLGEDDQGTDLEVIAVELEESSLLVIHAMRLRARYRERYEEVRKWEG